MLTEFSVASHIKKEQEKKTDSTTEGSWELQDACHVKFVDIKEAWKTVTSKLCTKGFQTCNKMSVF